MTAKPFGANTTLCQVSVIEPVGGHAGMNTYNLELARGLYQSGTNVRLYTCDETFEVSERGVAILKPFRKLYGPGFKLVRGLRFVGGLMWAAYDARRNQSRVTHLHYFQFGLRELACCIVVKAMGMKVVATAHDITPFSRPEGISLMRTILKLTDHVIVHNKFSAGILSKEAGTEFLQNSLSVIPIGNFLSSTQPIERAEAKSILSLSTSEPILLFFGQIKPEKGLEELLHAFAHHRRAGGQGFLLVAGRPMSHAKEDYVAIAGGLGLSEHVRFDFRYIPDDEVAAYYCAANLVVLPYREIYQSAVLLMAMSYGRPVLGSDLPPIAEVIEDGVTGMLFKSGDVASLTASLARALQDSDRLKQMGCSSTEQVKRKYDWKDIGKSTADVYLKALGQD